MFENIKNSIAHFFVVKKYTKKNPPVISFNSFFSKSVYYLVVMPKDNGEFEQALSLLKFLVSNNKNVTILVHSESAASIPTKSKFKFITYSNDEITRLNLPNSSIAKTLGKKSYDVVIDLNLSDNVFSSAAANMVDTNVKIGFVKKNSDKYYNLQFSNAQNNSELSYKNLVNSLGMF